MIGDWHTWTVWVYTTAVGSFVYNVHVVMCEIGTHLARCPACLLGGLVSSRNILFVRIIPRKLLLVDLCKDTVSTRTQLPLKTLLTPVVGFVLYIYNTRGTVSRNKYMSSKVTYEICIQI